MNYYDTLSFHLVSVIFMLSGCILYTTDQSKISYKVITIIGTVITLVTGGMLFQRFGMPWSGPYPIWSMVKIFSWLGIIGLCLAISFKLKKWAKYITWPIIMLFAIAGVVSIYKPL